MFDHVAVAAVTRKNAAVLGGSGMAAESVVIANYRSEMKAVVVDELLNIVYVDFIDRVRNILPGVGNNGVFDRPGLESEKRMRACCSLLFQTKKNHILLLIVPGSVLGFAVTSCDDDFLGIRNCGGGGGAAGVVAAAAAVAAAIGLLIVAADGLVSLEARSGGDATCGLFIFAPEGVERARCFSTSFTEGEIVFDAPAVGVDAVADDEED